VKSTAERLCSVGLLESAARLLQALDLPVTSVVGEVARSWVMLEAGRGDARLVLEDGPCWHYGSVDGLGTTWTERCNNQGHHQGQPPPRAYELGELQGQDRAQKERALAAFWLLFDLVERLDSGHKGGWALHTEAVRSVARRLMGLLWCLPVLS
jgi:hypothetical protein